ncbi:MAG TPA: PH domain-containing protein [Alphaproteobacteria bacterium]|nr:PH domain-containing protein [Alphaproteobacteria bacterium]HNS44035.1 PH domain-containing protein [Alphaproteobacteria bacterium]
MLYVQQVLSADEKLIYVARFHWFYDVQAIMAIVWGVFFSLSLLISVEVLIESLPVKWGDFLLSDPLTPDDGWLAIVRKMHPVIKLAALLIFLLGVLRFAQMMVIKVTTEICVTSNRIIYKRGLIARNVGEMSIDRIESVSVHQSFWGRIFDFGRLIIHGMGVGEMIMPNLAEPIRFRKAIEHARNG